MMLTSISGSIQTDTENVAKVVLFPGDPLRAKFIAETFLEDPICFNTVRNMLGYTGTYKGKKISVISLCFQRRKGVCSGKRPGKPLPRRLRYSGRGHCPDRHRQRPGKYP